MNYVKGTDINRAETLRPRRVAPCLRCPNVVRRDTGHQAVSVDHLWAMATSVMAVMTVAISMA